MSQGQPQIQPKSIVRETFKSECKMELLYSFGVQGQSISYSQYHRDPSDPYKSIFRSKKKYGLCFSHDPTKNEGVKPFVSC